MWLALLGSMAMAGDQEDIAALVDGWHAAAARADAPAYFGAMTDTAVFIGTDKTERWTRTEFEAFAKPYFQRDSAWSYTPTGRHITVQSDVAWFDEQLTHASYGDVRGSGVVVREPNGWKIAHYVLSFPIPNERAQEVIRLIKSAP